MPTASRHMHLLALAAFILLALSPGVSARRERDTPRRKQGSALTLKNADYNENMLVNGEFVSTLKGNVTFLYDDLTVRSDNAKWWREQGTIRLDGNVKASREEKVLTCDQMTFLKNEKNLDAAGRVVYVSPSDGLRLTGRRGRYNLDTKRFVLTGEPKFVRTDSTARDTLTITGVEMVYDDSLRTATVTRSVVIARGELRATSERAHYITRQETAHLRGKPHIVFEGHTMDGDSVDLFFAGDTLKGVKVIGKGHALYREPDRADTNVTNVWADSMYLDMIAGGGLDSVWAWGNVRSTYYLSSSSDSANSVTGKTMILSFGERGSLNTALVTGNAQSTYFVRDRDSQGRNEASGDSILVYFEDGRARELVLSGKVRGKYHTD